ncbi:hypothetical protein ZOSMA_42G00130 [Zostera marina]|uniref:Core Histone H2A/H2B/H3 domain-containing protein n=1 Tax=Zostera marina TaxID=29655 RepID=A0A0K9P1V8_ZOSMR|nr:hypothetical protein ZOSMA_42G00130 [Zostera marina]
MGPVKNKGKKIQNQRKDGEGPSAPSFLLDSPVIEGDDPLVPKVVSSVPLVSPPTMEVLKSVVAASSVAAVGKREAKIKLSKILKSKTAEKKKKKRNYKSYKNYIKRLLKNMYPEITLTSKSLRVMDECVADMLRRIADETRRCAEKTKKKTIKVNDIIASVKLVYKGDLAINAIVEGKKALEYHHNKSKKKF